LTAGNCDQTDAVLFVSLHNQANHEHETQPIHIPSMVKHFLQRPHMLKVVTLDLCKQV